MGYKAKTRVVISSRGAPRELIAIRELENRDLLIILKLPDESGSTNGPFDKIIQHKFSLHQNPRSPTGSRTVKGTLLYQDGRVRTTAALWQPRNGAVAALLFLYRTPAMDTPSHLANIRSKDSVISIGEYDPRWASLAYAVFVGNCGALDFQLKPTLPFTKTLIQFQMFEVAICHTFMNAPSIPRGELVVQATSGESWNGSEPDFQIAGGVQSIDTDKVNNFLCRSEYDFRNSFMHQTVNWMIQNGETVDDEMCAQMEELAGTFTKIPLMRNF